MNTQESISSIPKFTPEQLAYLATLKQNNPDAFEALTTQKPVSVKQAEPVTLPKVGDAVDGRSVYLGGWAGVHAYAANDFLRDAKGKQLLLNFAEATKEFANRNGGRRYGDGSEANIRQAIAQGHYHDGDLVLPSKELLHGRDENENTTRPDANIFALMSKGALPKVAAVAQNGKGDQRWALSGSEHLGFPSFVCHVRLADGGDGWDRKAGSRSGVVPVRLYRQSRAIGPAPQVGG